MSDPIWKTFNNMHNRFNRQRYSMRMNRQTECKQCELSEKSIDKICERIAVRAEFSENSVLYVSLIMLFDCNSGRFSCINFLCNESITVLI